MMRDILHRTVVAVGLGLLDAVDNIHSVDDLAEYGVLAVEMRSAAHGGVGLALLGGEGGRLSRPPASR